MNTQSQARICISDKQWILLLAVGFFIMVGGSWFSQFEPDRQLRAQMRQSFELPAQINPGSESVAPSVYAEVIRDR